MIIKVSTHLSLLMTVTTLTTMITAKNDHSKQRHCFCKLDHSAHQDDHHYTHDRGFCCYITIVAGGGVTVLSGRLHQRHHLFLWGSSSLLPPSSYTWWIGNSINRLVDCPTQLTLVTWICQLSRRWGPFKRGV